jgi:hypothetical protein
VEQKQKSCVCVWKFITAFPFCDFIFSHRLLPFHSLSLFLHSHSQFHAIILVGCDFN